MFKLCALLLKQCQLRVGGIEDRLLLRDIEARDRAALVSFAATLTLSSSNANAVFWRGITAPTDIIDVDSKASAPLNFSKEKRGILVTT